MKMTVRPRLNEILKEKNMKQKDLAEQTGITAATISRFDRCIQHSDIHLFTIAKALHIKVDDLFEVVTKE